MRAALYFKSKVLEPGQLQRAVEQGCIQVLGKDIQIYVQMTHSHSGYSDDVTTEVSSLYSICDLTSAEFLITAYKDSHLSVYLKWETIGDVIRLFAPDDNTIKCMNSIITYLRLESTSFPEFQITTDFEQLQKRMDALEKAVGQQQRRLACFISFKFGDPDVAMQVNRLKDFLTAISVDWITGEEYEPRRIEEKVKAKLRADVDFLIAIISKGGQSTWLRDEMADAQARGLWVMVLVEDTATFEKGIFGSLQYIRYHTVIDEVFLSLAQGVNFIRAGSAPPGVGA